MTQENKMLLGVGLLAAVAAYFAFSKKTTSNAPVVAKCGESEAPCPSGNGCYDIRAKMSSSSPCFAVKESILGLKIRRNMGKEGYDPNFNNKFFPEGITQATPIVNFGGCKNYVSTKDNNFFQPQSGGFSKN